MFLHDVSTGCGVTPPDAHLRAIVDTVPTQIWSARADGAVDFVNRRWVEYTGLSADQAVGSGWAAAVHPDDQSRLIECSRSILDSGTSHETEVRIRRADGEYRWFLFRGDPLKDGAGAIVGWCGTNTDIDDQRRAIDSLPGFVCTNLADGSVERVNDTLLRYTGRTQEELKDWPSVVHRRPARRCRAMDALCSNSGRLRRRRARQKRRKALIAGSSVGGSASETPTEESSVGTTCSLISTIAGVPRKGFAHVRSSCAPSSTVFLAWLRP